MVVCTVLAFLSLLLRLGTAGFDTFVVKPGMKRFVERLSRTAAREDGRPHLVDEFAIPGAEGRAHE
jgi:hypothetical protein